MHAALVSHPRDVLLVVLEYGDLEDPLRQVQISSTYLMQLQLAYSVSQCHLAYKTCTCLCQWDYHNCQGPERNIGSLGLRLKMGNNEAKRTRYPVVDEERTIDPAFFERKMRRDNELK